MKRNVFFSDEFMDDLAERVARKLATRFYKNGFFHNNENHYNSLSYCDDDYSSYDNFNYNSSGGCGSGSSYQPNGGC